jgi:short chain dehydrogenase
MSNRLSEKVCVITGTSGSIGREAALTFARDGALVVGCGLHVDDAEATVEVVRASGGAMLSLQPCNLSKPADCQALVDLAVRHAPKNRGESIATIQAALDTGINLLDTATSTGRATPFLTRKGPAGYTVAVSLTVLAEVPSFTRRRNGGYPVSPTPNRRWPSQLDFLQYDLRPSRRCVFLPNWCRRVTRQSFRRSSATTCRPNAAPGQ